MNLVVKEHQYWHRSVRDLDDYVSTFTQTRKVKTFPSHVALSSLSGHDYNHWGRITETINGGRPAHDSPRKLQTCRYLGKKFYSSISNVKDSVESTEWPVLFRCPFYSRDPTLTGLGSLSLEGGGTENRKSLVIVKSHPLEHLVDGKVSEKDLRNRRKVEKWLNVWSDCPFGHSSMNRSSETHMNSFQNVLSIFMCDVS